MRLEPPGDVGVLVCRVIIRDDMNVQPGRSRLVDLLEKVQPPAVGVGGGVKVRHFARCVVERGEECRGPVAGVVVRGRPDMADPEGEPRLGPFKRLALRLLVAAEHHGLVRGRQVKADNVPELRDEVRIVRHLEGLGQVRFDPAPVPDRAHGVPGDADGSGHAPRGVARASSGRRRGLGYDSLHRPFRNRCRPAPPGFLFEPGEAFRLETGSPFRNGYARCHHLPGGLPL